MSSQVSAKEIGAAFICIVFGGFFAFQSVTTLSLGSARQMGPGYFPFAVSLILIALGLLIGVRALQERNPDTIGKLVSLRSLLAILAAPVMFGMTVRPLGFVPALMFTAIVSTYANKQNNFVHALLLGAGLTAFCVAIFSFGLGTNLPLFGPWFPRVGW
jgi:hypothetical protein